MSQRMIPLDPSPSDTPDSLTHTPCPQCTMLVLLLAAADLSVSHLDRLLVSLMSHVCCADGDARSEVHDDELPISLIRVVD